MLLDVAGALGTLGTIVSSDFRITIVRRFSLPLPSCPYSTAIPRLRRFGARRLMYPDSVRPVEGHVFSLRVLSSAMMSNSLSNSVALPHHPAPFAISTRYL